MANEQGNPALFLDLAGTLLKLDADRELPLNDRGEIVVELLPGVVETLQPIRDHLIFVVTNQSSITRGRFSMKALETAIEELDRQLGGILTGWRVCPHRDGDGCECRKPKPGMVLDLARSYGVALEASTLVGDQAVDEQCARVAGVGRFVWADDFFGRASGRTG